MKINSYTRNLIYDAIRKSEVINMREERSIPIVTLKRNIGKQEISERDFREYLSYLTTDESYIEEVTQKIYHVSPNEIDKNDNFKITSIFEI